MAPNDSTLEHSLETERINRAGATELLFVKLHSLGLHLEYPINDLNKSQGPGANFH